MRFRCRDASLLALQVVTTPACVASVVGVVCTALAGECVPSGMVSQLGWPTVSLLLYVALRAV